jgi:hypothetical protein
MDGFDGEDAGYEEELQNTELDDGLVVDEEDLGADESFDSANDTDGDGLDDLWEQRYENEDLLDWNNSDSDNNGIADGDEDYDLDGLTNLEEYAAGRMTFMRSPDGPHPLRKDILVEVDYMVDKFILDDEVDEIRAAYSALNIQNVDGSIGVLLHFVLDETDIIDQDFDGSFSQRHEIFKNHGPTFNDYQAPPMPLDKMVHLIIAGRRTDIPQRGGEVVTDVEGDIEKTGVFLYLDVVFENFPQCERPIEPILPPITASEMVVATIVHEFGHLLQLGHDTEVGGGINYYNIMSIPTSCNQAHQRVNGIDNHDQSLGSTQSVSAPRFSDEASLLMEFTNIISIDTALIEDDDGYEM